VLGSVQALAARIASARLELVLLGPAFLDAALAGDALEASRLLGARVPESWPELGEVPALVLERLCGAPALAPRALRAIELCSQRRMVGTIGSHGPPPDAAAP